MSDTVRFLPALAGASMLMADGLVGSRADSFFRAKSLYVTGVVAEDILKRAQIVLLNAMKQDKTERQVLSELDDALADYLPETDASGSIVNVPARIENIARTNLADAIGEGRYATFTDPDLEGFVSGFQYSAILDDRTRPTHAAWDNVTLPADDPTWFNPDRRPPNGFQCRCVLVPVTLADQQDWTPEDELPLDKAGPDVFPDPGFK